jgi:hypothetical protein
MQPIEVSGALGRAGRANRQGYAAGVMSGLVKPGSVSLARAQALLAYIKT